VPGREKEAFCPFEADISVPYEKIDLFFVLGTNQQRLSSSMPDVTLHSFHPFSGPELTFLSLGSFWVGGRRVSLLAHPRSLTTYEWLFKWVIEEAKNPIRHKDSPLSEQQMALHRLADLVTGEVLTGVEN